MKMKFTAAFALAAWLLVAAWLASMVIAKPAVLRLGNQAEDSAAMAELRNAIARNRKAMEGMEALRGVAAMPYAGAAPVVALPVAMPAPTLNPDGSVAANRLRGAAVGAATGPATYAVSLVLVTDGRRTAVVNGEQIRAGSRLADGARVSAIGADWVRIDDPAGGRQTYRVRDPLAPENAGGPR